MRSPSGCSSAVRGTAQQAERGEITNNGEGEFPNADVADVYVADIEYTARAAVGKKKVRQSRAESKRKREEEAALLP